MNAKIENDKDVKIIVATHKKYQMPKDDIYIPLQVNAEKNGKIEGFDYQDNTGDNISIKNPYFCELTGLYWAWKNLQNDHIGLVHYRRYFSESKHIPKTTDEKFNVILNKKQVNELLSNNDIILPKKRNYYIENLYSHYEHTMYVEPLNEVQKIIAEKSPEYL